MDSEFKYSDADISEAIKAIAGDLNVYVNLLTDFGFKRVFGIKEVMLHFLNTVLDIEGGITDLTYANTEILGLTKEDRKAIYDFFCVTGKGERIIVEMQTIEQEHFKDRVLFYASLLIQEQNIKGKIKEDGKEKDWNFMLQPVYSVNILNFSLNEDVKTDKYASYVQLMDRDTKELFFDKLTFVYIELPRFTKELNEITTIFELWIFIIKRLHELQNLTEELQNEIFEKVCEIAKIAKMNKDEVYKYIKSLYDMNIVQNEIRRRDKTIEVISAERDDARVVIEEQGNIIALQVNTIAQKDKEIAEYRRLLGLK